MEEVKVVTIEVVGTEFEIVRLTLTDTEVKDLYNKSKNLEKEILEINKKLLDLQSRYDYSEKQNRDYCNQIRQAENMLTALGVNKQTEEENNYYKDIDIAGRIGVLVRNLLFKN